MRRVGRIHISSAFGQNGGEINLIIDYGRAESMFISRLFLDTVKKYCDKNRSSQSIFQDDMGKYKTYFLPHEGTEDSVISLFIGLCEFHLAIFKHHGVVNNIKEFFEKTKTECKEYIIHFLDQDNNKANMLKINWLLLKYAFSNFQQRDTILNQIARECWGAKDDDNIALEELKFAKDMFPIKPIGNERGVLVVNRETVKEVIKALSCV